ncbi:MAG: ATP-binding protein [Kofleriaceae bacterium]
MGLATRWKVLRFRDWPVRRKTVALLVAASLIPLSGSAILQTRAARTQLRDTTAELLAARTDQLRRQIETFELAYQLSATKLSRIPAVVGACATPGAGVTSAAVGAVAATQAGDILGVHVESDRSLIAAGIVDRTGRVILATAPRAVGMQLGATRYVADALRGSMAMSELYVAGPELDDTPAIGFAAPVSDATGTTGAVVLWARGSALWDVTRSSHGLAGRGSFAVVVDELGIRIAHSSRDDFVFRPSGRLAPEVAETLARTRRFGAQTRRLLADVRAFPEMFERATAPYPDGEVFHGISPVNHMWSYGVARRLSTSPWTVFYLLPEREIDDQIAAIERHQAVLVAAIMIVVFLVGLVLASVILSPVRRLSATTARIAAGDLTARVPVGRADNELSRLCASFNAMAERIAGDDAALRQSRDQLEQRVAARTAALTAVSETEARARAALEVSSARLEVLSRTGHELAAVSGDREAVLELAVRRLGELIGEDCAIRLVSEDGAWLEPSEMFHVQDPARRAHAAEVLRGARSRLGEGVGGRVAATGEALLIAELTAEQRARALAAIAPAFHGMVEQLRIASLLTLPLRSRDRTIGAVTLARSMPGNPYTLDDQRFAQEIADRAGLAIDNAVLVATLERRVQARTAALELANHELEAFSYSVSHDLRAPRRAIDGFSQVVLSDHADQLDDEAKGYLHRVRAATQRMAGLIDDLLNLARITRTHLSWTSVDLSSIATQIIAELRARDPDRATVVHLAGGVMAQGDARLLTIALENLLGNAWKFTKKHPAAEIWFGQEQRDGRTVLAVRDTGAGFDMKHAEKLFVPFQRLHAAADYEGVGIGLATVQRIVARHGGQIWAESEIDRGAVFYIALGDRP